jgi:5-methylthioadenosine/S-adenosylhomocysteine deaminase
MTATIYPRLGIFPDIAGILRKQVKTGFGTDWMQNDPFEGMRNAMNVSRVQLKDANFLPCQDALWHSTMGSAKVLGIDSEVGSLEAGKKADLIMLDLAQAHMQPYYGDYSALVYYAKSSDVVTSIVDGRVIMRDGVLSFVDEADIIAQVLRARPDWARRLHDFGGSIPGGRDFGCACCA